MNTIWKYVLDPNKPSTLFNMPPGAKILSVGQVGEDVCLWAQVSPPELHPSPPELSKVQGHKVREFVPVITGEELPEDVYLTMNYLGTVVMQYISHAPVVVHVFEKTQR